MKGFSVTNCGEKCWADNGLTFVRPASDSCIPSPTDVFWLNPRGRETGGCSVGDWILRASNHRLGSFAAAPTAEKMRPAALDESDLAVYCVGNLIRCLGKAAIDIANAASSMGQPERGLKPLRDLCANLPEGFDAPQLAEAKRLLSP